MDKQFRDIPLIHNHADGMSLVLLFPPRVKVWHVVRYLLGEICGPFL